MNYVTATKPGCGCGPCKGHGGCGSMGDGGDGLSGITEPKYLLGAAAVAFLIFVWPKLSKGRR